MNILWQSTDWTIAACGEEISSDQVIAWGILLHLKTSAGSSEEADGVRQSEFIYTHEVI